MRRLQPNPTFLTRLTTWLGNFFAREVEPASQEVSLNKYLSLAVVCLPFCAFLYLSLYFEQFHKDYFINYFNWDDVPYVLYTKGTLLSYVVLLFAVPSCLLVLGHFYKPKKTIGHLAATGIFVSIPIALAVFALLTVSGFGVLQVFMFIILIVLINFGTIFINRHASLGYIVLFGFFFILAAKYDARALMANPVHINVVMKDKTIAVKAIDVNKSFIGSTAQYIFIQDKQSGDIEKFKKEDLR